jgi:hypothetical protein
MTTLKDVETHLATLRNHAAREHDNLRASLPKLWRPEEIANAALKLRECEAKVGAYNDALTAIGLVTGTEAFCIGTPEGQALLRGER